MQLRVSMQDYTCGGIGFPVGTVVVVVVIVVFVVVVGGGVIVVVNTYKCRIGTCGGIGLPPGTVVVTEEAVDGRLRPFLDTVAFIVNITVILFLQRNHQLFVKTSQTQTIFTCSECPLKKSLFI